MTENEKSTSQETESQQLAKRLREVREYLNLSQQFVADKTGIPRSAVSDIERGARKVDSLELRKLARLYMYPVGYFLGEEEGGDDVPHARTGGHRLDGGRPRRGSPVRPVPAVLG